MVLTEYNVEQDGEKVFLSAGEASLPGWFLILAALFLVALTVWAYFLHTNRCGVGMCAMSLFLCPCVSVSQCVSVCVSVCMCDSFASHSFSTAFFNHLSLSLFVFFFNTNHSTASRACVFV
jgi:hypothetical protein